MNHGERQAARRPGTVASTAEDGWRARRRDARAPGCEASVIRLASAGGHPES
jgi:hypothetical protein